MLSTICFHHYTALTHKMNPYPLGFCLSDHTGDSDTAILPSSFWHDADIRNGRNIHLLGWNSDSEGS